MSPDASGLRYFSRARTGGAIQCWVSVSYSVRLQGSAAELRPGNRRVRALGHQRSGLALRPTAATAVRTGLSERNDGRGPEGMDSHGVRAVTDKAAHVSEQRRWLVSPAEERLGAPERSLGCLMGFRFGMPRSVPAVKPRCAAWPGAVLNGDTGGSALWSGTGVRVTWAQTGPAGTCAGRARAARHRSEQPDCGRARACTGWCDSYSLARRDIASRADASVRRVGVTWGVGFGRQGRSRRDLSTRPLDAPFARGLGFSVRAGAWSVGREPTEADHHRQGRIPCARVGEPGGRANGPRRTSNLGSPKSDDGAYQHVLP